MLRRLKIPLLIGLAFSGIAFGTVKLLGYNSRSFMVISYLYILLGGIIGIKYELKNLNRQGGLLKTFKNIAIVIEGEELRLKRLLTGEKYKLKGEIEKVQ